MKKKLKQFFTLRRKADSGFTLVELIVVIAILAILAGVAVPAYNGYIKRANEAADQQLLAALNTAYAAACMERGEYNMRSLSFVPKATLSGGVVTMETYDDEFQRYFGDGQFKYYEVLSFDGTNGVFTGVVLDVLVQALRESWNGSSFKDEDGTIAKVLLGTFDQIAGYFGLGVGMGFDAETYLMDGISDELADALGLKGMAEGYNTALNVTDEELEEILKKRPDYDTLTDDEKNALKNQIKGNLGVLYFAEDAAGRTVEDVKGSVDNFINVLMSKDNTVTDEELEEYFLSTADEATLAEYTSESTTATRKKEMLNYFRNKEEVIALSEDLKFTGEQAAAMAAAAKESGASNTAGVSMLGSMYALAAGFYNSDIYAEDYEGKTQKPGSFSDFDSVTSALNDPRFFEYYFGFDENGEYDPTGSNSQAKADMQAYLDFMSYLSTNPDADLTAKDEEGNGSAFAGQYDFIFEALGGK